MIEAPRVPVFFYGSYQLSDGSRIPLECAFQGSKVFERGGPFKDIYQMQSRDAKRDPRLRANGRVLGFAFEGVNVSPEPKTAFYDWLYAKTLACREDYLEELEEYAGFTDIEFNSGRSVNCQARACALTLSLRRARLLHIAIETPQGFIEVVATASREKPDSKDARQGRLF